MTKLVITAPHPTLRRAARQVTQVDKKLLENISLLITALEGEQDPPGVGMAFPQIDKSIAGFALRTDAGSEHPKKEHIQILFNPKIINHSQEQSLGEDPNEPDFEGCLSVPKIYGPVPRWSEVELSFQTIQNEQLVQKTEQFAGYMARIIQHELDHLNGVLFTDHLLKLDLPAYVKQGEKFEELADREIIKIF